MAKKRITEEEFPSNSIANKVAPIRERSEDTRVVEPGELPERPRRVVRKAIVRKKSFVQSIAEGLVGNSSENVMGYIIHEVLIPAAKTTIQEMVSGGIEMLLFGEKRSSGKSKGGSSKISYGSYYSSNKDRDDDRRDRHRASYRDKFDLSEIYFKTRRDADDILTNLCDDLEEYEQVSVADFFDLAGIEGNSWAHDAYGWTDLRRATVTPTRGGWQIIFPNPIPLE